MVRFYLKLAFVMLVLPVLFGLLIAFILPTNLGPGLDLFMWVVAVPVVWVGFQFMIAPWVIGWVMGVRWVEEEELPELHLAVAELAARAGLPKPKVGIADMPIPNAFAFGRSQGDGRVCITRGLLDLGAANKGTATKDEMNTEEMTYRSCPRCQALNPLGKLFCISCGSLVVSAGTAHAAATVPAAARGAPAPTRTVPGKDELKAILAHEITHIQNRDMMVLTLLSLLPFILYRAARALLRADEDGERSVLSAVGLALLISYVVSEFVVLYVSRVREYGADAGSVKLGSQPAHMASALYKLVRTNAPFRRSSEVKKVAEYKALFANEPTRAWREVQQLEEVDLDSSGHIDSSELMQLKSRKLRLRIVDWLTEALSTHPNTLRRIKALAELS